MHAMYFGTLSIDFRKAFDMVDHSLLIEKLAHYRLNITSLNWFRSYLSTRVQSIKGDNGMSEFLELIRHAPGLYPRSYTILIIY